MRILETHWWSLQLPEEWFAEEDEDGVVISDEDEVSVIQISALRRSEGKVQPKDLLELAEDLSEAGIKNKKAAIGEFSGFEFEYEDDGAYVVEWYLSSGSVVLLISYDCDVDNRDMDIGTVREILDTLMVNDVD